MTPNYDMDALPVSDFDRIMECTAEVLSEYRGKMAEFPQAVTDAFTVAARQMMSEATSEQDVNDRLAQLMISAFMSGRIHAQRGYPSPIPQDLVTDFEIPDELRPPS